MCNDKPLFICKRTEVKDVFRHYTSPVHKITDYVIPRYDARYFDPALAFLKATHTREGIQY